MTAHVEPKQGFNMFSHYQVSNENKKFIFINKIKQFGNNIKNYTNLKTGVTNKNMQKKC